MKTWKVTLGNDFNLNKQSEQPKKVIEINREFLWEGDSFRILSLYEFNQGLVLDFCRQVDRMKLQAYSEKWRKNTQKPEKLTDVELELMLAENPAGEPPEIKLTVNGISLDSLGCTSLWWQPYNEDKDPDAADFLEHYRLDPDLGWMMIRSSFTWKTKDKPELKHLKMHFKDQPVSVAGPHFTLNENGQQIIVFTHPQTGTKHKLEVKYRTLEQIPKNIMPSKEMKPGKENMSAPIIENCIFPTNYEAIHYTISPDLEDGTYFIRSVDSKGDQPISTLSHSEPAGAHTITVIGGSSGPTSVFTGGRLLREQPTLHTAYSPVYFETVEVKDWCITFRVRRKKDYTLTFEI
ncbi:MAG: hypothetical protein Q4D16_08150 [Eubacteriales bacterium]|nr:hypothetical protein [Eubacteriales bacterium]